MRGPLKNCGNGSTLKNKKIRNHANNDTETR